MKIANELIDQDNFERIVLPICRQVFAPKEYQENYLVDGVEHDGMYVGEFDVSIVEVTVSRRENKAKEDLEKILKRVDNCRRKYSGKKNVRGWFITRYPLTPEQKRYLKRYSTNDIVHQDYQEFVKRLVDSKKYVGARSNYQFGSAVDLTTESHTFGSDMFVQLPLREKSRKDRKINFSQLIRECRNGTARRILLTGDFGSGKSMHLRQLFVELSKEHLKGDEDRFPIAINLRDCLQLESPDEAIRRHADRIGTPEMAEDLIRAWRAGFACILLDGFDELAPRQSERPNRRTSRRYQDIRKQALLIVRRFVSETPANCLLLLTGRSYYFDEQEEMFEAIGGPVGWRHFALDDIATDKETERFLRKYGSEFSPPKWLPRKPLLLGYLAVMAAGEDIEDVNTLSAAEGWAYLLKRFCKREISQIKNLPFLEQDLYDIYGHLATTARKRGDGTGPISISDVMEAYRSVFSDDPEGVDLGQLLRLPGLVGADQERVDQIGSQVGPSSKKFISSELVDVCSSHFLVDYFANYEPYRLKAFEGIVRPISSVGSEYIGRKFADGSIPTEAVKILQKDRKNSFSLIDIIKAISDMGVDLTGQDIEVSNLEVSNLEFDSLRSNLSRVSFADCYFGQLAFISIESEENLPNFSGCLVENLKFDREYDLVNDESAFAEVVRKTRVAYTPLDEIEKLASDRERIFYDLLRKLYNQSGAGRLEKALYAGNPPHQHLIVTEMIECLRKSGLAVQIVTGGAPLWKPIPSKKGEVLSYLKAPRRTFFESNC